MTVAEQPRTTRDNKRRERQLRQNLNPRFRTALCDLRLRLSPRLRGSDNFKKLAEIAHQIVRIRPYTVHNGV